MIKVKDVGLDEILNDELKNDKRLTTNMKLVLAQAILYSGLEKNKSIGEFFRSNKDFAKDTGLQISTFRFVLQKLIKLGFIQRKIGKRGEGASVYKLEESYAKLNPFYQVEKVTAPRIQITEDEGNFINKLPSDSRQQTTEYRVEIKEEEKYENPLDGFSTSPYDELEQLLNELRHKDINPIKCYEEFAARGQEAFDWLCNRIKKENSYFYNGTRFHRNTVATKFKLKVPILI